MKEIKYKATAQGRCLTHCPFKNMPSEWDYVGAYECTERCKHFVSHDIENKVVVCNHE